MEIGRDLVDLFLKSSYIYYVAAALMERDYGRRDIG
jgi:hypothetical protein